MSFVESLTNIVVGYFLAILTQYIVFPPFGIEVAFGSHAAIAAVFSAISILRSYSLRRIFEAIRVRT